MSRLTDIEVLAPYAGEVTFAPGELLLREGEPVPRFYVLRDGAVAIQVFVPLRGSVTIETLHAGDLVGWSWLYPPRGAAFDARALEPTTAVAFDSEAVREACARDTRLEAAVLRVVSEVLIDRLTETRVRLLDLYGNGHA